MQLIQQIMCALWKYSRQFWKSWTVASDSDACIDKVISVS